jgi:hypothetical protein
MKKLFVLTIMIIGFNAISFAQEINQAKFTMSGAELKTALNNGEVSFFFNKNIDAEAVKNSTAYYTQYFSVVYDNKTGKSTLKLTEDDMSKMVISRYMMSNGISEVLIDGKTISVQDFMAEYLR